MICWKKNVPFSIKLPWCLCCIWGGRGQTLSILFHSTICLYLGQQNNVLISVAWNQGGKKNLPTLLLLFKVILVLLQPLNFYINFIIILSRKPSGILSGIAMNVKLGLWRIGYLTVLNLTLTKENSLMKIWLLSILLDTLRLRRSKIFIIELQHVMSLLCNVCFIKATSELWWILHSWIVFWLS